MSDAWPAPQFPEHTFAKALLVHGPLPPKGWYVTRRADGSASYIVARSKAARSFQSSVVEMLRQEVVWTCPAHWSDHHIEMVARSWKNLFMKWVWEKIDESRCL